MRYFGTAFSLMLGAWRLRINIDVEDAPDDSIKPAHHLQAARTSDTRAARTSSSRN
jgi:hypothetical protein